MSSPHHLDISRQSTVSGTVPSLPSSKSISNRALVINALTNFKSELQHLSSARDTVLMNQLIRSQDHVIDVRDAGTTMRFLTAYFGITGQNKLLTGTERMKERPIRLLVDSLRQLGVSVSYKGIEGFPPIEVAGFSAQQAEEISIQGDVSSQYISALMLVAPALPKGLTVHLEGKIGSRPYLEMTASLMEYFGIKPDFKGNTIRIEHGNYQPRTYRVEADWSAISYWFSLAAVAEKAEILLPGVTSNSLQGDRVIVEIMKPLGVKSSFGPDGLTLQHQGQEVRSISQDFRDCPDLAQTILPVCAVLGVSGEFTGLESLRIKETDRIAALQTELSKIGAALAEFNNRWTLTPGKVPSGKPFFNTYHDHRMAMGFAPLAARMDISIEDASVVQKSYPTFWDDMSALGFNIKFQEH